MVGRFRTAPVDGRDVTFVWSGDTVGQGWGINQAWGGLRLYEVMRGLEPDFFVNSGDMIYADGPLKADVDLPGGGIWKNLVTEAKSKVAETLEEYRGNYRYNLMDEHMRRFNAQVAQYVQWDDHEVTNNWFHERILEDDRYTVKNVARPGGAGEAGDVRIHDPGRQPGRERPRVSPDPARAEPRSVHDRHAELSRAE